MSESRRIFADILYEGKNISSQIREYVKGMTYMDVASGESDSLTLDIVDREGIWIGDWMPQKSDHMKVNIKMLNWCLPDTVEIFPCGSFVLDDLSYSGSPTTCNIGAVSIPQDEAFNNQKRTKTWEKINVYEMAKEIASRAGILLFYEADTIPITLIEQNDQTDCSFLYEICQSYGLAMKVYENKICIFSEEIYEQKHPVTTIDLSEMKSWSYNTTIKGTYTGATISYTDPINEKEYTIDIGGGERILEINVNADNLQDAERKGIAKLNGENKKDTTMSISIFRKQDLAASQTIEITGLKNLNGKYYIEKVKHKISGGNAYDLSLELRKVQPWIKSASIRAIEETKKEKIQQEGTKYTVKKGDTLWEIAKTYLGKGMEYTVIYNANKEVIESTAKQRGKQNSSNGHWIFPGTELIIPAKGEE